jgi:TolA-binding protein
MKALTLALSITLSSIAPFQCSQPDMNKRAEDTPSEALWKLSERFREAGDEEARRMTLEVLVEEYPRTREAERAKVALQGSEPGEATAGAEDAP